MTNKKGKNMSIVKNKNTSVDLDMEEVFESLDLADGMVEGVVDEAYQQGFDDGAEAVCVSVISSMLDDEMDHALIAKYLSIPLDKIEEVINDIREMNEEIL